MGAIGAYYRPDAKSLISISGAVSGGDAMYGIGYSQSIGRAVPREDAGGELLASFIERNAQLEKENEDIRRSLAASPSASVEAGEA